MDDFMGIKLKEQVWQAYNALGNLLRDLRVSEAPEKAVPPAEVEEFLGTGFDLLTEVLFATEKKLQALREELGMWINKETMKRIQVESIVGKLQAISNQDKFSLQG